MLRWCRTGGSRKSTVCLLKPFKVTICEFIRIKWFSSKKIQMKYFCLPMCFHTQPKSLAGWRLLDSSVSARSQAAFPTDHLRRRQQNRRQAPVPCAQMSLTVTLDKTEIKGDHRDSNQKLLGTHPGRPGVRARSSQAPYPSAGFPYFGLSHSQIQKQSGIVSQQEIRDVLFKDCSR